MTKYWLCLTNDKNWSLIKHKEVYGFDKKHKHCKKLLNVGDILVFYIIPKRIGGIFRVKSKNVGKKIRFLERDYSYQIKIKKEKVLSKLINIDRIPHLKREISIFKNARSIGSALFGRAIIQLIEEDYKKLSELINRGYLSRTDNPLFKNLILKG